MKNIIEYIRYFDMPDDTTPNVIYAPYIPLTATTVICTCTFDDIKLIRNKYSYE